MSAVAYLFLEFSTVVLFGLTLWHAARRGRSFVAELWSAALYGILLEWGNILIFETYSYSSDFWLMLGPVPIIIGLCWGLIIYSAMSYSDQLGVPTWAAPFADALWAILLDLAFDAIAIRLQLWTWTIPLSAGYFGVPADNFFAWLFVAVCFSAFTRWVRRHAHRPRSAYPLRALAPIAAFAGLWLSIQLFGVIAVIVYRGAMAPGAGLPIFGITVAVFAALVGWAIGRGGVRVQRGIDLVPTLTRWAMHGYFLVWAVLLTLVPVLRLPGTTMPVALLWIALGLAGVEALLLVPIWRRGAPLRDQLMVLPRWHRSSDPRGQSSMPSEALRQW